MQGEIITYHHPNGAQQIYGLSHIEWHIGKCLSKLGKLKFAFLPLQNLWSDASQWKLGKMLNSYFLAFQNNSEGHIVTDILFVVLLDF